MRRFFIPGHRMEEKTPYLEGAEAHHLIRVLRKKAGDRLVLFDDSHREFLARIVSLSQGRVFLEVLEGRAVNRESPLQLDLGLPLIRPQPLEWMLQKGTELGVTTFRPFYSQYSRRNFEDKVPEAKMDRFRKIIREAAKQCGRNVLPHLFPPVSFSELLHQAAPQGLKWIAYEEEGLPALNPFVQDLPPVTAATVLIGPEGGFSEQEVDQARGQGFVSLSLGPRILRSETAALALVSLIQFLWGDMGRCARSRPAGDVPGSRLD